MTGNRSKKTRLPSAPSFLDKSSGFYGRLDDTEVELGDGEKPESTQLEMTPERETVEGMPSRQLKPDHGVFHFNQGMIDDDGTTTLLRRKPSRWSRRSSRKAKKDQSTTDDGKQSPTADPHTAPDSGVSSETQAEQPVQETETPIVHFSIREEADDRALIWGQSGNTEVKEEKRKIKENHVQKDGDEQMKMAKRSTLKLYRKAVDRAFRRGWKAFVASLYSVSLSPGTSAPATVKAEENGGSVLIEYK